jgi:hypothetical protein
VALNDIRSGSNPGCNTGGSSANAGWDPVLGHTGSQDIGLREIMELSCSESDELTAQGQDDSTTHTPLCIYICIVNPLLCAWGQIIHVALYFLIHYLSSTLAFRYFLLQNPKSPPPHSYGRGVLSSVGSCGAWREVLTDLCLERRYALPGMLPTSAAPPFVS